MEEEGSIFDIFMHVDWFFGDLECQYIVHSLLDEIEIPLLTKSSLALEFDKLTILEVLAADYFTVGDDGYRPEKQLTYRVQYNIESEYGNIMKALVLPVMSQVTDRIAWLMSLSIQHMLASASPLFVPITAVDYFPQPNTLSKLIVVTPLYHETWHSFIVKNLDLPWFDKLTFAMSIVEAMYILHSHNIYIEGFSADHIVVDFEGNLKLQGPFSLHDYPMDYIDFQQCRDTDNGIENPYHNNIQALGVLLLELVLDVSKIPTDDNITDESKKDNVTGNITQDMICQAFMSGCPERLEALILWCIDSDPFLLPTMKHCREEMRMIYVDFCERNHIILREENEDVEEVEEAVEGKTTCNAVVEETSEYQDLLLNIDEEVEEKKSISSDLSPTDPFVVEELDNGEIILSPLKSRPSPKQRKVTLTGLNEKMKEAQGEISAANRRAQHGFQVLHQVEQQIHALQHFLAEELFQLQDPYSETSQHFSSDEEDLAQDDAHSSSEEQYRYLEKVLTLYDELDAVRQQIDEVCEVSFPEGIQSNIERYRDQDTSNLISSPNDSDEYNEHYEMDAFLHCDGRSIESDVESEKSEGNTVDLVDPVTEDQETLPDNLAILTGDTMEDQEEMELSTTRSFIVRNAMTNQYIHLSESPTNIELMCSTSSLSQIESQPMSSMEPELMASKEFVSYMEELTVEVQPSTERTTNTAVDLPSRVQISLPEVKEDDELIIIASPTFKPDMDHNFYRTTSSPALSTDSKQAYRDPKSMDCGDVYSSFSSDDNDSSEEEGTISSLQVHVPTETASKVDDSFNLTSELEDMEGEDQEEDDHADAYVALTICEVVSELLREVEQRPIVTIDEKQEVDLIRNSVEDVLALVTIQYAEELGKEDGNEANDTEVPGKAAIINSIPFSTAICPTYVPFQALGGDDNEEDDVVPSQTEHDNFISSSIVVLLPSNEGELGEPSTNAEIPPPPVLSPLGALFPDVSVPVRKSLIDALMKSDEETPAVPSIPANQEKPKEEVDEIVEVVTVTENNVEEILKIGEYGVDSGRDSVNSVPSEVVVGDEVISTAESLTPFSADYPEGIRTPLQFSPAPDSPSKINDMEPVHILDSVDDNSMNATPQKSEGRSRTESPSALSLATGSSDSKFRKIMKSLNLDVKRTNSADESSPLKLTDLGDQATTPDGKENSPLNTSRTTLSSHSDLGRSRTPDASMFPNSRPSPPISNFLQNIRQLDSLYQEELEVDHFTKSLEANNKVVSGSGNFTLVSAPITASPRLKSTSPIGRMLESYQSTVDPVSSYQNASTSQIAPKKELNSALHTFLQLVQRCNDTNNRTRDIVNNLDQKLHRQIANPPANTVNSNPRGGAPTIYDVYRQASPKTSSNFAASDRVGKSYSSPERNKILEASKKKAAAVSAFQKSQSSANEKLSKFKNSKSFSISPPKKKPSSDAMSQHSTWGSGRSKY